MTSPGFALILPPGWVRWSTEGDAPHRFERALDEALAALPDDHRAAARNFASRTFRSSLMRAQAGNVCDLLVPLSPMDGVALPVSITAAVTGPAGSTASRPHDTLLRLATRTPDARAIEIDGLVGLRRVRTAPATADSPRHRAISYLCHVPWVDQWMLFTAAIVLGAPTADEEARPLVEAVEMLADAIISTVRFTRDSEA